MATHNVLIEVWYPAPDNPDGLGAIQSCGGTTLIGSNKNGQFVDDDAPKKSVTDALSKALSWLGFGAAVHMGMFDGNKYVDLRPEDGKEKVERTPTEEVYDMPPVEVKPVDPALLETAKKNCEAGSKKLGIEEYKAWHKLTLSNFFSASKLEELTVDQIEEFIEYQRVKIGKDED